MNIDLYTKETRHILYTPFAKWRSEHSIFSPAAETCLKDNLLIKFIDLSTLSAYLRKEMQFIWTAMKKDALKPFIWCLPTS